MLPALPANLAVAARRAGASARNRCAKLSHRLAVIGGFDGTSRVASVILMLSLAFGVLSSRALAATSTPDGAVVGATRGVDEQREISPPMVVRVILADGASVSGVVTNWSHEGLLGSFGFRRWVDMHALEVWRLFRRVMDQDDPVEWIALGEVLLLTQAGAALAEASFRTALRLEPEVAELVDEARSRAARTIRARSTPPDAGVRTDRLRTEPPEWLPWSATPWPTLDTVGRSEASRQIRDDIRDVLTVMGLSLEMVRTDSLLLYASGERMDLARLAVRLESTRVRLAERLGIAADELAPQGRIAVIVVDRRDDFRALQQRIFLQRDRPDITAMAHFVGPKAFVIAFRGADGPELEHALAWQLVHAFMHRYISPKRLPPWANEGLAASVAAQVVPELQSPRTRRRQALGQLRSGFDPIPIFDAAYGDPPWPGPNRIGPDLGRLLVELLAADQPVAFSEWVTDVKQGEPWGEALGRRFRMPPNRIIQIFIRHHQVRD